MIKRIICLVLGMVLGVSVFAMIPLQADAVDMHVSDACVELIKQLEGFSAVPRWDYSQWTVGFGTACPAEHLDRYLEEGIPLEEAEALLAEKLVYFDERVNKFIEKNNLMLTQGQYDAIFSLTYNCGASWLSKSEGTLYQAIVNGATGNEFIAALSAWCTAGGSFLYGLMMRRLVEAEMYLYGKYDVTLQDYYCYVKFDANGGSRSAAGQGYDTRYAAPVMATATYEGHTFQGWYTAPVGGTKVTTLTASHHGTTLYAHWDKDSSSAEPIETVCVTVTADVLNIRSGAGTGHTVVAQAKAGDQLDITAVVTVSGIPWGQCVQGWVCLDYTNYALVAGNQNGSGEKTYATITASAVNVRSGPGASYSRVTTLHKGDVVEILEQTTVDGKIWGRYADGWFRITGYATVDTVGEGGTENPTEPSVPDEGGTPPPESGGDTTPSVPKDEVELPKAPMKATVLGTDPVAIRNGPHKTYPSRGEYAVGTRIEFVEFMYFMGEIWGRTDKGWLNVNSYVMLDEGNALINTFFVTVQTSALYVRTGPGASYDYVRTVKYGTELEIYALEEVNGNTWGRIYCGWISLKYTNYDPSMVPDQTPKYDCETEGHSYVDAVTAPTCTEAGYTTHTCEKCGHSYTDSETAAIGHNYADKVVPPACGQPGYTEHTCQNCGDSYRDNETAALGHSYFQTVVAPTCETAGYSLHTCTLCGDSFKDQETPALGHHYVSTVTPPTTKEQGYTTHTCERCGHSYVDSYTDPIKNTITVTVTKAYAKITASAVNVRSGPGAGYSRVTTLHRGDKVEILEQKTVSGKIWGRYEDGWFRITGYATLETVTETYEVEVDEPDVPECEHSYTHTVKAPTCTETGYTTHTCEKCGHSYKDSETAAIGHSYISVVTPPTTTAQGYTTHTCQNCGNSYVDSYTDPVKDTVTITVTKTYATITASAVNVRKGAGASYGKVTTLHRGDVVEILEQKTVDGKVWGRYEDGWFRITGYAKLKTVTEEIEVPKPEEPEQPEVPSEPEKPVEPEVPSEPEQPEEPETPVEPEIPEIETVTKVYATITAGSVNVRKGAGASYGWVMTLHRGDVVEILEQTTVDGRVWGRCEKGWFRITGYATLETVEETNTTMTVNTNRLNIRKGPGTGYDIVGSLTYGTVVKVFEIKNVDGTNWARIEQGWVSMDYLK